LPERSAALRVKTAMAAAIAIARIDLMELLLDMHSLHPKIYYGSTILQETS